jgi:hypothetical protein
VRKCPIFGKGQKTKGVVNNGLGTKSAPNQLTTMEAQFAHLEVSVMNMASNMATQMKPTTLALGDYST